jgi:hypothetical protein
LCGDDLAAGQQGRVGTEQHLLDCLVVGDNAVDRQVTPGGVLGHALGLGFDHGTEQRNSPLFVAVNAHAQIDLGGPRVGVEGFVETQDRIAGCQLDSGEQAHFYQGSR